MNGRLVPERRQDKAGRIITRWVRPAGDGQPEAPAIPLPAATGSRGSRDAATCRAAIRASYEWTTDLASGGGGTRWDVANLRLADIEERLDGLDAVVLAAFADAIESEPGKDWGAVLVSVLHARRTPSDAGHLLAIIRALDEIDTAWDGRGTGCWTYEYAEKLRAGMDHLRAQNVPVPELGVRADGGHDERITALASLTVSICGADADKPRPAQRFFEISTDTSDMLYLKDRDVARLVLERPEAAGDIARVWSPRRDLDAESLREIVDGIARPLQEGAL